RSDEHVRRPALARDAAHDVDEIVTLDLEEVNPEHAGQPAERLQLCRLLLVERPTRTPHPERVDIGTEPLRRPPRAPQDSLRLRLGLDEREHALGDGPPAIRL